MRQAVQVLALVTLDVPANLNRAQLRGAAETVLRSGCHIEAQPTGVQIRSIREEAAIFDNNRDQWVVGPHGIYRSDAPQFCIGFAYSQGFGQPFPDQGAMPGRIAEALNLAAGATPTLPAGLVNTLAWALGMATEAISLREQSDDEEDTDSDMLAMHKEELAKGGAMLALLRSRREAPDPAAIIAAARELVDSVEGDIFTDAEECEGQVEAVFEAAEGVRNAIADFEKGGAA